MWGEAGFSRGARYLFWWGASIQGDVEPATLVRDSGVPEAPSIWWVLGLLLNPFFFDWQWVWLIELDPRNAVFCIQLLFSWIIESLLYNDIFTLIMTMQISEHSCNVSIYILYTFQWFFSPFQGVVVKTDYIPLLQSLAPYGWRLMCVLPTPIVRTNRYQSPLKF